MHFGVACPSYFGERNYTFLQYITGPLTAEVGVVVVVDSHCISIRTAVTTMVASGGGGGGGGG